MGEVLERLVRRMERHLRRNGLLRTFEDGAEADREDDPEGNLAASAVFGQAPPAGPQWVSRLALLEPQALAHDKPLCASVEVASRTHVARPSRRASDEPSRPDHAGGYRPWAELLARTFAVDVLACSTYQGRMKLLALVKGPASIARYLATMGEATEVAAVAGSRSAALEARALRLKALGDEDEGAGRGRHAAGEEVA